MYQYLLCLLSKQIGNCFLLSITKIQEMTNNMFFFQIFWSSRNAVPFWVCPLGSNCLDYLICVAIACC